MGTKRKQMNFIGLNRNRKRVHFGTPAWSAHSVDNVDMTSHYPAPPPSHIHLHYNPPPSLSSILLCQPRSCSAISLRSRWYWGWCRYLWAEQLVKFATHACTHARLHEHTLFSLISHFFPFSLFPSLEFVVSSLHHGAVPQLPALNTLQLFPHDMDLIWNNGPRPQQHFILLQVLYGTVSARANTATGIKLYH